MRQTRVNLRHLLEDIRDGYPCSLQEAILTELISNSLDSRSKEIHISVDPENNRLTVADDGEGMNKEAFENYHDIASSRKQRGKGIGFAGIGAKLSLLVCDEVVTETKYGNKHLSSTWALRDAYSAPWESIEPIGLVKTATGTAVRLHWKGRLPYYAEGVRNLIKRTFYPLLDGQFSEVMNHLYPHGLRFWVNGEPVTLKGSPPPEREYFLIGVRKRNNQPTGIGFLERSPSDLPEPERGVAIATYGKVIKRGWEWLGIVPRTAERITGIVEVPELVACLATHKCDFLGDAASKRKFYDVRKKIQKAVSEQLAEWGVLADGPPRRDSAASRVERELDEVIRRLLPDFPELRVLIDPLRPRNDASRMTPVGIGADARGSQGATTPPGSDGDHGDACDGDSIADHDRREGSGGSSSVGPEGSGPRRTRAGLMITLDQTTGGDDLGWLRQGAVVLNALHPAYKRVEGREALAPYIAFAVASLLAAHLGEELNPVVFIQRFLTEWGRHT